MKTEKPVSGTVKFNYDNGAYLIEKRIPDSRPQIILLTDDELLNLIEYRDECQRNSD